MKGSFLTTSTALILAIGTSVASARCFQGHIEYCSYLATAGPEAFVDDGYDFEVTGDDDFKWTGHKGRNIGRGGDSNCSATGGECWSPGKEITISFGASAAHIKIGDEDKYRTIQPERTWNDYPYDCIAVQFSECGN
ncbi:hypothetical protein BGZ83_009456 [Gryganskiella cystojenkinii]|nr:hypothetical protein BGZ83_009456 [Gryganskiella cystojenkinii]